MRIAILDYGAGNLFSLRNALERAGAEVELVSDPSGRKHDGIVLPGVGSFDPAVAKISRDELVEWAGDVPVLGICLGMEMLFETSQEGSSRGLGIIPGRVVSLPDTIKVPHMGWNNLRLIADSMITAGIEQDAWAYFVHSYMVEPKESGVIAAVADYGAQIPAIIEQGNYVGTQFHPEKSGAAGKKMIENFLGACRR